MRVFIVTTFLFFMFADQLLLVDVLSAGTI